MWSVTFDHKIYPCSRWGALFWATQWRFPMHFHKENISLFQQCFLHDLESAIVTSQWSIVMSQSSSNCDVTKSASERGTDFGCLDQFVIRKIWVWQRKGLHKKYALVFSMVFVCYEECPISTCEYSVQLLCMCSYLSTVSSHFVDTQNRWHAKSLTANSLTPTCWHEDDQLVDKIFLRTTNSLTEIRGYTNSLTCRPVGCANSLTTIFLVYEN